LSLLASIVHVHGSNFKSLKLLNFFFNADKDPAFHSNVDPDPDPGLASKIMLIRSDPVPNQQPSLWACFRIRIPNSDSLTKFNPTSATHVICSLAEPSFGFNLVGG
jgi:hypothetical protein